MKTSMKKIISILAISTLIFGFSTANGGSEKKTYRIWVTATAYCPCSICCGKGSPGITKTGRSAWKPGVAVDPKVIPLGSHLDIPGYNRGPNNNGSWILCDDIGGAIKGNHIDVRFKTHAEAKKWGVKKIKIRVHKR
jgi:3D (Asp-Asp-Asp) domain-containing protein